MRSELHSLFKKGFKKNAPSTLSIVWSLKEVYQKTLEVDGSENTGVISTPLPILDPLTLEMRQESVE